jgi:hypothetical protein
MHMLWEQELGVDGNAPGIQGSNTCGSYDEVAFMSLLRKLPSPASLFVEGACAKVTK